MSSFENKFAYVFDEVENIINKRPISDRIVTIQDIQHIAIVAGVGSDRYQTIRRLLDARLRQQYHGDIRSTPAGNEGVDSPYSNDLNTC